MRIHGELPGQYMDFLDKYPIGSQVIEPILNKKGRRGIETLPTFESSINETLRFPMLIREDYKSIWGFVEKRHECMVQFSNKAVSMTTSDYVPQELVIYGSSGIGKTNCLSFLLANCLSKGWPTIVDFGRTKFYYRNGAVEAFALEDQLVFQPDPYTVILIDAKDKQSDYKVWANVRHETYIIVAASPNQIDVRSFTSLQQCPTAFWVMSPWSRAEVHDLQKLESRIHGSKRQSPDFHSIDTLFELLGGSARQFISGHVPCSGKGFLIDFEDTIHTIGNFAGSMSPDDWRFELSKTYLDIPPSSQKEGFHTLFLICPRGKQPQYSRPSYELKAASMFTAECFRRLLLRRDLSQSLRTASYLQPLPGPSGGLYESYCYAHLAWSDQPTAVHVLGGPQGSVPTTIFIPALQPMALAPLNLAECAASGIPPAKGYLHAFPRGQNTIDAIIPLDGHVHRQTILLRIIKAKNHPISVDGLSEVVMALQEVDVNETHSKTGTVLPRSYALVFVVPDDKSGQLLVASLAKGLRIGQSENRIPVGYIVIPLGSSFQPSSLTESLVRDLMKSHGPVVFEDASDDVRAEAAVAGRDGILCVTEQERAMSSPSRQDVAGMLSSGRNKRNKRKRAN